MDFQRPIVQELLALLKQDLDIFHALIGPRQVGKTTAAEQIIKKLDWPHHIATADSPLPPGPEWIEQQWQLAKIKAESSKKPTVLMLDEIQKVRGWSEILKQLWDEKKESLNLKLLILGSSSLLMQEGLTESLAGRFLLHRVSHWSWDECNKAFGWDLNKWIYYGGYPGAAQFVEQEKYWKQYISNSLVETVLARDVLQLHTVTKPTLLRHLFALSASLPAQILSYNKMLGQLQDAGNTTTLAHYLKLLDTAFMVSGLELFSRGQIRKRRSSPKLILWNNALINALSLKNFEQAQEDRNWWGRLVENAVGAHLLNQLSPLEWAITYWRKDSLEVDYVVSHGENIWALEVKSGRSGGKNGLAAFRKNYPHSKQLIIGAGGLPIDEFFEQDASQLLGSI